MAVGVRDFSDAPSRNRGLKVMGAVFVQKRALDEEGNRAQHKVMLALVAPAIPLPKGTEPTALA